MRVHGKCLRVAGRVMSRAISSSLHSKSRAFLPSHTNPSKAQSYTVHAKSVCSPHWHEIFLNDSAADTGSVAESVATGHSILVLDSDVDSVQLFRARQPKN